MKSKLLSACILSLISIWATAGEDIPSRQWCDWALGQIPDHKQLEDVDSTAFSAGFLKDLQKAYRLCDAECKLLYNQLPEGEFLSYWYDGNGDSIFEGGNTTVDYYCEVTDSLRKSVFVILTDTLTRRYVLRVMSVIPEDGCWRIDDWVDLDKKITMRQSISKYLEWGEGLVESTLRSLSLREKVSQMFWVREENLKDDYPAGGVILYAYNCKNPEQLRELVADIRCIDGIYPLICIDEEGGRVCRIACNDAFALRKHPDMTTLCQEGSQAVYDAARYIGGYLSDYGIDIDLAPVADVNSNPLNPIIGTRAFSGDPQTVGNMAREYLAGLKAGGVTGCLKHFPGHGDTQTDTHLGYAESRKTWEEMLECEIIPFKVGIESGARMIMTSHITAPCVDTLNLPSTLSRTILTDKLRGELGYDGIIITDGMGMGAISQYYSAGDAAIKSIEAGADVVLGSVDYTKAVDDIVGAVENGLLSEGRIDESVRRILNLKMEAIASRQSRF